MSIVTIESLWGLTQYVSIGGRTGPNKEAEGSGESEVTGVIRILL